MIFPILHIPGLGDGMTIALDAVLHVLISHGLAIGLASMLVLFQTLTWLGKGAFWAQISRGLLGPVVVITTSIGAVTGVGIWFITGALAPEGIGSLIHLFFWPWFIEWGAFTTEVVLLLIYYYLWDRLAQDKPGVLAALGWGYVAVAVSSAFLISGILGFMLTPDGWPWGQTFREAYFNPTFIPQFLLRVAGGLSLGSLCLLGWTAWRYKGPREDRNRALRLTGAVFLGAALVTAVCAFVYFSRVPQTYLTHWKFAVATSYLSQLPYLLPAFNGLAALCILATALAALSREAAKLPRVNLDIRAQEPAPGRDTTTSIQHGLVFGFVCMVEGLTQRLKRQMPGPIKVLAAGGFAASIARVSPVFDHVLPALLLDGLRRLYYEERDIL